MTGLSASDWQRIKVAYLSGRETVAEIAERYGTTSKTIHHRRHRLGWPKRSEVMAAAERAGPAVNKDDLVLSVYRLISLKLEHLEEDMARSNDRTAADNERDTRAIGTMIRNLEKTHGVEQAYGNDDKQNAGGPERSAEAEAIRRELAQRLARLRKPKSGKRR